ncbi:MAG: ribosome assembly cofactor RimP [Sphaerochaetaceae bacterium]
MDNKIRQDGLFKELSTLLSKIGLLVVDVRRGIQRDGVNIVVIITNQNLDAGVDECTSAHRLLLPRLAILEDNRAISLEVSTPGLQRNFRDFYEFSLFKGRRCRVYDRQVSDWVEGLIEEVSEEGVVLAKARLVDRKEIMEKYTVKREDIHKAKLAYAWEDMK